MPQTILSSLGTAVVGGFFPGAEVLIQASRSSLEELREDWEALKSSLPSFRILKRKKHFQEDDEYVERRKESRIKSALSFFRRKGSAASNVDDVSDLDNLIKNLEKSLHSKDNELVKDLLEKSKSAIERFEEDKKEISVLKKSISEHIERLRSEESKGKLKSFIDKFSSLVLRKSKTVSDLENQALQKEETISTPSLSVARDKRRRSISRTDETILEQKLLTRIYVSISKIEKLLFKWDKSFFSEVSNVQNIVREKESGIVASKKSASSFLSNILGEGRFPFLKRVAGIGLLGFSLKDIFSGKFDLPSLAIGGIGLGLLAKDIISVSKFLLSKSSSLSKILYPLGAGAIKFGGKLGYSLISKSVPYLSSIIKSLPVLGKGALSFGKLAGSWLLGKGIGLSSKIFSLASGMGPKLLLGATGAGFIVSLIIDILTKGPVYQIGKMVWEKFSPIARDWIGYARDRVSSLVSSVLDYGKGVWTSLAGLVQEWFQFGVNKISEVFSSFKSSLFEIWNFLKDKIREWYDSGVEGISSLFRSLSISVSDTWNSLKDTVSNWFSTGVNELYSLFSNFKLSLSDTWDSVKSKIGEWYSYGVDGIYTLFRGFNISISETWNLLIDKVRNWYDFGVQGLSYLFSSLQISTLETWDKIRSNISDWFDIGLKGLYSIFDSTKISVSSTWDYLANNVLSWYSKGLEELYVLFKGLNLSSSETWEALKQKISSWYDIGLNLTVSFFGSIKAPSLSDTWEKLTSSIVSWYGRGVEVVSSTFKFLDISLSETWDVIREKLTSWFYLGYEKVSLTFSSLEISPLETWGKFSSNLLEWFEFGKDSLISFMSSLHLPKLAWEDLKSKLFEWTSLGIETLSGFFDHLTSIISRSDIFGRLRDSLSGWFDEIQSLKDIFSSFYLSYDDTWSQLVNSLGSWFSTGVGTIFDVFGSFKIPDSLTWETLSSSLSSWFWSGISIISETFSSFTSYLKSGWDKLSSTVSEWFSFGSEKRVESLIDENLRKQIQELSEREVQAAVSSWRSKGIEQTVSEGIAAIRDTWSSLSSRVSNWFDTGVSSLKALMESLTIPVESTWSILENNIKDWFYKGVEKLALSFKNISLSFEKGISSGMDYLMKASYVFSPLLYRGSDIISLKYEKSGFPVYQNKQQGEKIVQDSIKSYISEASYKTGIDEDFLVKTAFIESRLNPRAINPKTGASGLFQFLPSTWKRMVQKYGEIFNISEKDIMNPAANATMAALLAKEHAEAIKSVKEKLGINSEVSSHELYLAHLLGQGKALRIIKDFYINPQAQILDYVNQNIIEMNKPIFQGVRTVEDLMKKLERKFATVVQNENTGVLSKEFSSDVYRVYRERYEAPAMVPSLGEYREAKQATDRDVYRVGRDVAVASAYPDTRRAPMTNLSYPTATNANVSASIREKDSWYSNDIGVLLLVTGVV